MWLEYLLSRERYLCSITETPDLNPGLRSGDIAAYFIALIYFTNLERYE